MQTKVTFVYDEQVKKWEPIVSGVADAVEARQAFTAVMLTVQQLDPELMGFSAVEKSGEEYKIIPIV